jgi:alpha-D-xyloside xylohydrolase
MQAAHEKGTPVMRPMFYEFPDEDECWTVEDQYMYGGKYLCAPVLQPGVAARKVYLPKGRWEVMKLDGGDGKTDEEVVEGGKFIEAKCPLEMMPVYVRLDE